MHVAPLEWHRQLTYRIWWNRESTRTLATGSQEGWSPGRKPQRTGYPLSARSTISKRGEGCRCSCRAHRLRASGLERAGTRRGAAFPHIAATRHHCPVGIGHYNLGITFQTLSVQAVRDNGRLALSDKEYAEHLWQALGIRSALTGITIDGASACGLSPNIRIYRHALFFCTRRAMGCPLCRPAVSEPKHLAAAWRPEQSALLSSQDGG